MESNVGRGADVRPWSIRLAYLFGFTGLVAVLASLAIRDWTSENLFKTVMIGMTFCVSVIFLVVGMLYFRFAAGKIRSWGWRRAFVYLYIVGIALMLLLGLVELVEVLAEGRWSGMAGPLTLLAVAAYNTFALLPPMWHKIKITDQASPISTEEHDGRTNSPSDAH